MNKKVISIVAIIALVAILGVCLVACNADSYAKKLEKAGYEVKTLTGDEADEAEGLKWAVMGVKRDGLTVKTVSVLAFDNADDAKEYANNATDLVGKDCVHISGKIVIVGSSADAVKDAR